MIELQRADIEVFCSMFWASNIWKDGKNIGLAFKKSDGLSLFFGVETGLGCHTKRFLTRVSWIETVMRRKNCLVHWAMKTFWMEMKQQNEQDNRCTWVLSLGERSEMFNILQKSKYFLIHLNLHLLLYVFLLISTYIFEKLTEVQMPVGANSEIYILAA